uniref:Uncharacterized protein n=1 Tax=Arundo donax TaxID=35708 RepID=A0A0A9CI55_ARUDO
MLSMFHCFDSNLQLGVFYLCANDSVWVIRS